MSTRASSLLATLRIANAPSVVSNIGLGYMLGWFYWGGGESPWLTLLGLSVVGLCLYFGGNLANDWFDHDWDATNRPERALPAGHFKPSAFLLAALVLGLTGCLIAARIEPRSLSAALIVVLLIALYTYFHKKTRWAVVPMGLCRAGLYAIGFFATWPEEGHLIYSQGPPTLLAAALARSLLFLSSHALGLLVYISGLSLAARYESIEHPPHGMVFLSRAMLLLPLAAMSAWWMRYNPLLTLAALIPFSIWLTLSLTRFRRPIPVLVSALLAGIPLIDFITALPLAATLATPEISLRHQPLLLATVAIPLGAFVLGRLLQRYSPAT